MSENEAEPVAQAPATWENLVVGEAKKIVGHVLHDKQLVEQGEDQDEAAHEVRQEWDEEKHDL